MISKDRTVVAAASTVVLGGSAVSLDSDVGGDFVKHCARNVEGLLSEGELRAKYQLRDEEWAGLATNEQLLSAVRAEVDRRIANGECARDWETKSASPSREQHTLFAKEVRQDRIHPAP